MGIRVKVTFNDGVVRIPKFQWAQPISLPLAILLEECVPSYALYTLDKTDHPNSFFLGCQTYLTNHRHERRLPSYQCDRVAVGIGDYAYATYELGGDEVDFRLQIENILKTIVLWQPKNCPLLTTVPREISQKIRELEAEHCYVSEKNEEYDFV